ncbi:MAG: DUF885 domain-containing protein [Verrucomicrobia bacterium]|nr:DUF885 domain-containing protein [Verrucomicrobiota bacterium]
MIRRMLIALLLTSLCFATAFTLLAETDFERDCAKLAKGNGRDAERLHQLIKLHWEYTMHENPEFATGVGYPGQNHRWTDNSLEAIDRRKRELQAPMKVIQSINRSKLKAADQLNYDLFKKDQENAIEGTRFKGEYMPLTQLNGVQQDVAQLLEISPRAKVKDYEDMIARFNSVPTLIDQTLLLLNKGLETGITPPRITLRDVPQQVLNQLVEDPDKNAMLKPFTEFPLEIPTAVRDRLRKDAAVALKEEILPAFRKLHEFLVKTYLPGARESIAMSDLPDGKAWYAYNVRTRTTTSLTPQQIHELGLSEVKRIRAEMDKVIAATGFKGSFDEFLKFLRKDSRFYFADADSLLTAYREICKRADPELAKLFGKLPRLPYGVLPVPAYAEKSQTTAYYQPGSPQAGRPGYYYANTYALDMRPKWEMEALTLHESVPGHHLQIALAQEMTDAPEFRKHGGYTAFVEGWGLYAESLGDEMGFYKDPYMKFGQLTYEMWRAIRLVVDTGMHSMGWTRQRAIDYFLANASKNEHDVTVEVDRYIVWPGQALAYKIGQLKMQELRDYAKKELGDRFDIRAFHDELLGNGALPMDILETRMKAWTARQKR